MNAKEQAFLSSVVPAAQATMKVSGVPASVTVAQAILESGWGSSGLAEQANNYFGIKAEHLADAETYCEFPTAEYVNGQRVTIDAKFEKYPTVTDCFEDHAALLSQAKRYAPAMAVKSNAEQFAAELQACGYSTSPTYAAMLTTLIKEFDLEQYDAQLTPSV